MRIRETIVLLCIFLFANTSKAQDQRVIDSLVLIAKSTPSDTLKVDTYVKIARSYDASDSAKTVAYANRAIALAQKIGYKIGEIDAYYARAHVAMSMGHVDVAGKDFQLIVNLSRAAGYKNGEANGLNGLGATRDFQGDYSKALEYFFQSLKIAESQNDLIAMSSRYNNIGLIYSSQEDYVNALEYLRRSLTIHEKIQDLQGIALVHGNIGETYLSSGQLSKALDHSSQALELYEQINDLNGIANMHTALANVYQKQRELQKSIDHFLYAQSIYDKIGGQYFITYTYLGLGVSYVMMENYKEAKKQLELALKASIRLNHIVNMRESYKYLSIAEEKLGNFQEALAAQRKYQQAADSVLNTEQTKNLTRLEANYEFEKEKDSIAFEQKKAELAYEKEISQQRWIKTSALVIALFLALIASILYWSYRLKKKKNEELEVKNIKINDLRKTEKKMAEEALALKDRELTTITMLSHERNSLLQQLEDQIGGLSDKVDEEVIPDIKEIKKTIKANLSDESWSAFVYQFEKVHPKLFDELQSKFPSLTKNDLRLCAYIRVGMDRKEMAAVSNVTPEAIKKSLYRLKKKMNLDAETDIREFLTEL